MLLVKLKVDDPVDASPVHGFCGIWGVLAASSLAQNISKLRYHTIKINYIKAYCRALMPHNVSDMFIQYALYIIIH